MVLSFLFVFLFGGKSIYTTILRKYLGIGWNTKPDFVDMYLRLCELKADKLNAIPCEKPLDH